MTVKEDLIEVRALIDTPEKWRLHGVVRAMSSLPLDRYSKAKRALVKAANAGAPGLLFQKLQHMNHSEVMAVFDRAIAAQDGAK